MKTKKLKYFLIKARQFAFVFFLLLLAGIGLGMGVVIPKRKKEQVSIEIVQEKPVEVFDEISSLGSNEIN